MSNPFDPTNDPNTEGPDPLGLAASAARGAYAAMMAALHLTDAPPWEGVPLTHRQLLTMSAELMLGSLIAGEPLPRPLTPERLTREFSVGFCRYLIEVFVAAFHDYTLAHLRQYSPDQYQAYEQEHQRLEELRKQTDPGGSGPDQPPNQEPSLSGLPGGGPDHNSEGGGIDRRPGEKWKDALRFDGPGPHRRNIN